MIGGPTRLSPASLYAHERASVLIPLPFLDLPPEARFLGLAWLRKSEFHVTAAHAPAIADRIRAPLGLDPGAATDAAWEALLAASAERAVGAVVLGEELRIARRDGARTLVRPCEVEGLPELYSFLSERLGVPLDPPPAHVTLYTGPDGESIGLHTGAELERDTDALDPAQVEEVRRALAAAGPGR